MQWPRASPIVWQRVNVSDEESGQYRGLPQIRYESGQYRGRGLGPDMNEALEKESSS